MRRAVVVVAVPLVAVLSAGALGGCGATATAPARLAVPLAAATAQGTTTLAVLPVGIRGSFDDTFWQLFVRAGRGWRLSTPPDVATNGGVVAAAATSGTLTAGVRASNALRFSPLARSTDGGRSWATAVAPGALVAGPSALATTSGSTTALIGASGGEVVSSAGSLGPWVTLATQRSIARDTAPGGCGIAALSAVAVAAGSLVVGGACTATGRGPLAVRGAEGWRLVGPVVGATRAVVVRLAADGDGVVALFEVASRSRRTLLLASSEGDLATWRTSPPLEVTGDVVVSTTLSGDRASVVLERPGGALEAASALAGGAWGEPVTLPARTVDVVGEGGALEALVAGSASLTVLGRADGRWRVVQYVPVPISVGSSS